LRFENGDDYIRDGSGSDQLFGGEGNDTFDDRYARGHKKRAHPTRLSGRQLRLNDNYPDTGGTAQVIKTMHLCRDILNNVTQAISAR
jgi:Ca2+-binding RTX toxin-like protein